MIVTVLAMKAYSVDLRRRVLAACDAGQPTLAVARRFDVSPAWVRRLKQHQPGQLGAIGAALEAAGVNIITQYSDHSNQLILITDNADRAAAATAEWVS